MLVRGLEGAAGLEPEEKRAVLRRYGDLSMATLGSAAALNDAL